MPLESDELTDDWYYSDRKYITNSMLGWALSSPAYLYKRLHTKEEDTEKYYEFGKAMHMKLLEPDKFAQIYHIQKHSRPVNSIQRMFCEFLIETKEDIDDETLISAYKLSYSVKSKKDTEILKKAKNLYKENKAYIFETKENKGRIFLDKTTFEKIKRIEHNIRKHKKASSLIFLHDSEDLSAEMYAEKIILFENNSGIKMKSKLDKFVISTELKTATIIEFKTYSALRESDNMKKAFQKSFSKFNYDRQMFVYFLAVSYFIKNELNMDPEEFKFKFKVVAAKSNFDNEVRVFSIHDDFLDSGAKKFGEALDAYFHYQTFGFDYPYGIDENYEEELKPE